MGQTASTTNSVTNKDSPSNTSSDFYLACHNGDVKAVEEMLPHLNIAEINCIEANGSTPLHAASFYGHKPIVQMLLQHGAKPWTTNKYKMTPYQEARDDEIRSLFRRPLEDNANHFADDDTDTNPLELISERKIEENTNNVPNGWLNGYKNIGEQLRSNNIKLIVRAQIMKYYLTQLQKTDDCARELQKILRDYVPSDHRDYKTARFLFDEYCSRNQIDYLIRLYTLETKFYRALRTNVEVFAVEIYSQLSTLQDRFFKGQSYRGLSMLNEDLDEYKWAVKNQGTLIEIKTLTSTSVVREVAYDFARVEETDNKNRHRVLCELKFNRPCSTAINLQRNDSKHLLCLSTYEDEAEVLVLPGTLFEVHGISQAADTGRYTIVLNNIHVPFSMIQEAIKEAET